MLYTQIFQEVYYQADVNWGGRLPIHVTFMLDEFANVALPDDFCSLLSTMRSREISSIIIIQNFAQLKACLLYTSVGNGIATSHATGAAFSERKLHLTEFFIGQLTKTVSKIPVRC